MSKYVDFDILKEKKIVRVDNHSDYRDYNYLIIPIIEYKETVGICGRTLLSKDDMKLIGVAKYRNSSFKRRITYLALKIVCHILLKRIRFGLLKVILTKLACGNTDAKTVSA